MDLIVKGGSFNAQRFLTAVDILNPDYLENVSRALWKRLYEQVCLEFAKNDYSVLCMYRYCHFNELYIFSSNCYKNS